MTISKKQLEQLIQQGESYNLEFKEGYSKDIGREICAFANANGGKILVGVSDDGSVKGVDTSNERKSVIQGLTRNIEPSIDTNISTVENVILIEVPEGIQKPYSINGKFFLRTGPNSQQLNREEVKDFFQKERRVFFDELINEDFSIDEDIDEKAFIRFVHALGVSDVLGKGELLDNLDLLKNDRIKNAGVLLFSKRVTRYIRTATITCALFQGYNKYKVLDSKEFDSDLYTNFTEAINYLKAKLDTEYIIKGGPREERLELPEEALREAVLNAIAHRDYYSTGNIQVSIYKDRVEIDNPGGLFGRMKVNDLFGRSLPRNPLLFGLMQRMNLVEKIGSGLMRIQNAVKEYGLPDMKLEADGNWFKIIFKRKREIIDQEQEGEEGGIKGGTESGTKGGMNKIDISDRQKKVLHIIEENPQITIDEISKIMKINRSAVQKHIEKLKEKDVITRIGSQKSGYWEILK